MKYWAYAIPMCFGLSEQKGLSSENTASIPHVPKLLDPVVCVNALTVLYAHNRGQDLSHYA
ncbi:hypothetical protein JB92DRAFT_2889240 [Gautieria morchelliformis]|nr:hypothetical protein JB92DRAFT_2889240 [Gautieria morchelliformis]